MTWQGGKISRAAPAQLQFARLKPLVSQKHDVPSSMQNLAHALSNFAHHVHLHIQLVDGQDPESVTHWGITSGNKSAEAKPHRPKSADVVVMMRSETWAQIACGELAPYEALFGGKLRVGGNFAIAKALTKHLSDPTAAYTAPC